MRTGTGNLAIMLVTVGITIVGAGCSRTDEQPGVDDAVVAQQAERTTARQRGVPLRLTPERKVQLGVDGQRVVRSVVDDPDGGEVPVVLECTTYDAEVLMISEARPDAVWRGALNCTELRPAAPDSLYTWAIWSSIPLGNVRLLSDGQGTTYLAWAAGMGVGFADVSTPRCRSVALAEYFAKQEPSVAVPVRRLVPDVTGWGKDALFADIRVQSIARNEPDGWTVKVSGPDTDEVFTLVFANGEWRRE